MPRQYQSKNQKWILLFDPTGDFDVGNRFDIYSIRRTAKMGHFAAGTVFVNTQRLMVAYVKKVNSQFILKEDRYE